MSSSNDDYTEQEATIEQDISSLELDIETNYRNIENIQSELDEVLESLGQNDDRKIDVIKLPDELANNVIAHMYDEASGETQSFLILMNHYQEIVDVDTWVSNIFEKHRLKLLFDHMKDFFDVTDDELESKQHRTRFALEVGRATLQIHTRSLEKDMEHLQKKLLKLHPFTIDVSLPTLDTAKLERFDYAHVADKPDIDLESKSEQPIDKQFKIIRELETRLRELLANIFSREADWWKKFVPLEITEKCQYRNRKDPDFERIQKEQSSELIDKLMFKELQIIITGSDNDNFSRLFRNVFDSYHYVNSRLIEASILRNQICHMNELNPKKQMQLENIKSELVYDIDEYLKSG
jgi:hypothetical protein